MLVNVVHDTPREHRRLLAAGVGYLCIMALLIGLAIAIYQKVFTPVTWVTVEADSAGLQLPKFGDVRMHGVLVGQVRSISQNGHLAVIKLGLQPAAAKNIPDNVSVDILPTTLFGQKYVSFVDAKVPASGSLTDGTVIPASRVNTSVELETVLAKLYPLLTAVKPQDLDVTLNALASGLAGRGNELGETMQSLNTYLATMNVHLPTLQTDLHQLAQVSHNYALAAPDIVTLLHNATTTARTITQEHTQLAGLFGSLTSVANDSSALLAQNEDGLVTEGKLAVPLTRLLSTYSPEFPCLLEGLDRYTGRLNQIFQHNRVNQTMILSGTQRPAYGPQDHPEYGEIGHGPWCLGLPVPAQRTPLPPVPLKDGSDQVQKYLGP